MKEIVFLQDEKKARIYDNYINNLKKKLNESKTLAFLDNFNPVMDTFVHSGLACRTNKVDKITDINSINRVKNFLISLPI